MAVHRGADILGDLSLQKMRSADREFDDLKTARHLAKRIVMGLAVLDRLAAPVDLPSSLAFGGPDRATLFLTSIRDSGTGRAVFRHPEEGHLFAISGTGATGLPEAVFPASAAGDRPTPFPYERA